jgi:hypothetical protein
MRAEAKAGRALPSELKEPNFVGVRRRENFQGWVAEVLDPDGRHVAPSGKLVRRQTANQAVAQLPKRGSATVPLVVWCFVSSILPVFRPLGFGRVSHSDTLALKATYAGVIFGAVSGIARLCFGRRRQIASVSSGTLIGWSYLILYPWWFAQAGRLVVGSPLSNHRSPRRVGSQETDALGYNRARVRGAKLSFQECSGVSVLRALTISACFHRSRGPEQKMLRREFT